MDPGADLGDLTEPADRVGAALAGARRVAVAFSGGVDSSVLLALAVRALGPGRVLAVVGVSPSLASTERDEAHRVAAFVGAPVVEVPTAEGERDAYRRNGPDRCYHCKDELFARIEADVLRPYDVDAVAYGENADDVLRPDRPGSQAAREHGVLHPLADAGLDKAAVRRIARAFALPCADKPAAPCLASRIPHFTEVDPQRLAQVEAAEAAVRALGFSDCRVRHHGDVARVEVPTAEIDLATAEPVRSRLVDGVRAAGFRFVAVDLAGLSSGAFTLPLVAVRG